MKISLYLFFFFLVYYTCVDCDSSLFQILKSDGQVFTDFSQLRYPCVNVQVNVHIPSYVGCAFTCQSPELVLSSWGLLSNNTECYYFSYGPDGACTVGLTSTGSELSSVEIQDGEIIALTEAGISLMSEMNVGSEDGKLQNLQFNRCVEPQGGIANAGVKLVFASACNDEHKVRWYQDGRVQHIQSGLCMAPIDNSLNPAEAALVALLDCATPHEFRVTELQNIQLISSNQCIHPYQGTAYEGKELVLVTDCSASPRLQYTLV